MREGGNRARKAYIAPRLKSRFLTAICITRLFRGGGGGKKHGGHKEKKGGEEEKREGGSIVWEQGIPTRLHIEWLTHRSLQAKQKKGGEKGLTRKGEEGKKRKPRKVLVSTIS